MLADDIADYLSTQGLGTVATDIFTGQIPDNVDAGFGVRETGGLFPEYTFGSGPSGIGGPAARVERPRFQLVRRDTAYATARAKIGHAFNVLDGLQARTINGVKYHWVSAVQSPFDLGRDENQRSEWAVNFDVVKAVSTSTTT